jgi:hypothetical protein
MLWSRAKFTAFWTSSTFFAWIMKSGPRDPFSFLKMPGKVDRQTLSAGHPLSQRSSLHPAGASVLFGVRALSGSAGMIAMCWILGAAKKASPSRRVRTAMLSY